MLDPKNQFLFVLFLLATVRLSPAAYALQETRDLHTKDDIAVKFNANIKPLLNQYCAGCHNASEMESGIRVDHLDGSLTDRQLFLWEEIKEQVSQEAMPPEDQKQPSENEKRLLENWISETLHVAKSQPRPKNGSTRRLTVQQYRNTIKELLGIEDEIAERLPPDSISRDGFVNNEKSMLLSPLLIEAYFEIAQKALDICIVDEKTKPVIQNFRVDFGRKVNNHPYPSKLILGANSHLLQNDEFVVNELIAKKPFAFTPFRMQQKFRYIEGYRGNATVRGWKEFNSIYHAVFACMRGNGGYPKGFAHETVPEGLLLRPAIPSKELFGIESTYGPKANFKIALRELPEHGKFMVKVKAAKYVGGMLLDRGESAIGNSNPNLVSFIHPIKQSKVKIQEPGIYQAVLYTGPAEFKSVAPDFSKLGKSLVGSWSFENQFDGVNLNSDNTKPELNGIALGGAKVIGTAFGKSLSVDGKNDSVVVKRHPSMNVGEGDFTVSAWIRPTELRQGGIVCLGKYSGTHGWYLDMPNNKGVIRIETANPQNQLNGTVQSKNGIIKANQWQHVAAVVSRKPNETRIYVNGFEVARGTISKTNLDNPNVDLHIGRIQDAKLFKGEIDEVKIYTRLLGISEIQALLVNGKELIVPPQSTKPRRVRLSLSDTEMGHREVSGMLNQSNFALVRLAEGELRMTAECDGSNVVTRLNLVRVENDDEVAKRFLSFEKRNPKVGVYVGLRRDCGHTLAPVGSPIEIDSKKSVEFRFEGAINNFPSPDVEKNNVNYLAGVREIGIRSEYTDGRETPQLLVKSVEFEGPYYESWPPATHQAIFIDSLNKNKPLIYAREILHHFASRAFRRPATKQEVDSYFSVFETSFDRYGNDFNSSIKDAIVVVLTSPQFLFLLEKSESPEPEPLNQAEVASKLSYFLWNSPPDKKTLELASRGELTKNLDEEVARMINDSKFSRFCNQFCKQWLELEKFDVVEIDRNRFPRLTRDTIKNLRKEPVEFIRYLIANDLPLRNLVDSDFLMANEVTATYYELDKIPETGFRFAPIQKERPELGGLLSQAAIMSGLSDGRASNPVKRGAWIARKIIAEPPDDPPPNVPALSKDTSKLPLRQRLEVHRNQKGCAACHSGIDPWGLPLEQFDAGGRFINKVNTDSLSILPDKTEINGYLAFKSYLLEAQINQVAFSFTKHLTTYAIGRSLTYNEIESLKQKCVELKARNYKMQDIVRFVVKSRMFLEK